MVQNPSSQSSQEEQLQWMVRTRDSSDLVVEESSGGAAWLDASASDSPGKMWGLSTSALDAPTLRWGELLPFYITLNTAYVTVLPIQVPFDLSTPMRFTAPLGWIWEPAVVASGFWQDAAFGSTAALPGNAVPTVSDDIFLSWTTPMAFVSGEIYGFRVPVRVPRWPSTGADFLLELGNWSGTADAGQRPLAVLLPGPSLSAVRGAWVDYVTGRVGEQHGVRVQLTTTTPIFAGGGFIFEGGVATRRLRCSCPGTTDGYTCAVQSLFSGEILLRIVSTRALLAGTYSFPFLCTNPPNAVPAGSWRFATYQDPENYPDATEVDTPSTVPGFAVQEALQHFERLPAAITWSFDPRPLRDSSTILAFTLPGNGVLPSSARLRGPEARLAVQKSRASPRKFPVRAGVVGKAWQWAGDEADIRLSLGFTGSPVSRSTLWDWNKICAYHTNRVVRIQDANLGYLYWGIVTLVVLYIQIVVFHIEGRHTFQEPGYGAVITKFEAKSFNQDGKAFDEVDLRHPVIEPSGAFIMTRRITMKGQAMGTCIDSDSPQKCPCGDHATCGGDGYCQVKTWCPSLGDHNVANPPPGAVVEDIFGLEEALLMIVAGIGFPSIGAKFHVAGSSPDSSDLHKRITLLQLLELADPPLKLEDVSKSGCVIAVNFFWSCDFSWSNSCEPKMSVKRVDDGTGFVQKRSKKQTVNGVETRDAQYMYGLRLIVDSSGIGRQISLVPIVIQLGSCLALVQIASMAADFLMVRMYDKDRCEAYYRCKVVETKDYSEMQEPGSSQGVQGSGAAASGWRPAQSRAPAIAIVRDAPVVLPAFHVRQASSEVVVQELACRWVSVQVDEAACPQFAGEMCHEDECQRSRRQMSAKAPLPRNQTYALRVEATNPLVSPDFNVWTLEVDGLSSAQVAASPVQTFSDVQVVLASPSTRLGGTVGSTLSNGIRIIFRPSVTAESFRITAPMPYNFGFSMQCGGIRFIGQDPARSDPTFTQALSRCAASSNTLEITFQVPDGMLAGALYTVEADVLTPQQLPSTPMQFQLSSTLIGGGVGDDVFVDEPSLARGLLYFEVISVSTEPPRSGLTAEVQIKVSFSTLARAGDLIRLILPPRFLFAINETSSCPVTVTSPTVAPSPQCSCQGVLSCMVTLQVLEATTTQIPPNATLVSNTSTTTTTTWAPTSTRNELCKLCICTGVA
ncbi:P2RX2 [Symbiodinium sp. CCMP2456]|nr:P2RX2 [Symbiodinium sp. CCMP2456]